MVFRVAKEGRGGCQKDNYYPERSIAIPLLEYKEWQSSSLATATTLIQESRDPRELQSKLLAWAHSLHPAPT